MSLTNTHYCDILIMMSQRTAHFNKYSQVMTQQASMLIVPPPFNKQPYKQLNIFFSRGFAAWMPLFLLL